MNCSVTEMGNRHLGNQGKYFNISFFSQNKFYILLFKMRGKITIQFPLQMWQITCFVKAKNAHIEIPSVGYKYYSNLFFIKTKFCYSCPYALTACFL